MMPFESPLHFAFVAVVRSDEIRAYKQKDRVGRVNVAIDGCSEILSGRNTTVVPGGNKALPTETREMRLQLISKIFVHVGIREEESCHSTSIEPNFRLSGDQRQSLANKS